MEQPNKSSFAAGFGFGTTSGVITTLGLIIGLATATQSLTAVIGGILAVAVTDAFSDSLGMHVSEELNLGNSGAWSATISTFISKLVIALTFLIPFFVFGITTAVVICVIWGLLIITILSYYLAKKEKKPVWEVVGEHILITLVVIIVTRLIGLGIEKYLKN